jgi:cell division transport system ATP-binding protein
MTEDLVSFSDVSRSYGRWPAIENVSFSIAPGEFVVLSGPSGAGKTTILRLIWMGDLPSTGTVEVSGFSSLRMRPADFPMLRRKIGVVFQDFRLLPDRSIYENVALPLEVSGASPASVRKRVFSILADMGLSHRRASLPHELSGGEQQRVAVARAMVSHPVLLLADEPTGNLDPETSRYVVDLLLAINRGGTAVVMATHDPRQIPPGSARFLFLDCGRLVNPAEWTEVR